MSPSITISPIPPTQGQQVTITYDGPLPANVTISWTPSSIPDTSLHIPGPGRSVATTVPSNALSMEVTDDDGIATGDASLIKKSP